MLDNKKIEDLFFNIFYMHKDNYFPMINKMHFPVYVA